MEKIKNTTLTLLSLFIFFFSCYQETAIPVEAYFSTQFVNADESVPVQVSIANLSNGSDTYQWTFEGASPASSMDENPGTITYNEAGNYTITLIATNVDGEEDIYTQQITVYDGIDLNFSVEVLESNYSPVEIAITNNTEGVGFTYEWSFEGGDPSYSTEQYPSNVLFEEPGEHQVKLVVSNGFESVEQIETIIVAPEIEANFDWVVNFDDDDYQVPVTITLNNLSVSATSYQWMLSSGNPTTSTDENPTITFSSPGTYTVSLLADNGKHTDVYEKDITVYPDTNLRTFTNVHFGINSAHNNNSIGAFYSTTNRESYTADQVSLANGATIDIVFSGLNSSFNFNKFISPDIAGSNGFTTVTNATHTKFINSQEICICGGLTVAQFDTMTNDSLLSSLIIEESSAGLQSFNQVMLPRIVLFETADGRKGAIKVKGFISDGDNSYIDTDIKIQKQ